MFGYVKVWQPELKVKELEAYKAMYCGLCDQLGRSFGIGARFFLSYDFTFLSMLKISLSDEIPKYQVHRCPFNPLKKVNACSETDALKLSADAAIIMTYYKVQDNIQDSTAIKKLGWKLLVPFIKKSYNQAAQVQPEIDRAIKDCMLKQRQIEEEKCTSIDKACEPTAEAMAAIFKLLSDASDTQTRVLERLGYLIGRFVYLIDALDDLESDKKHKNYNPILLSNDLYNENSAEYNKAVASAKHSLYLTIAEAEKTFALLEIKKFRSILNNIIELGLKGSVDTVVSKKEENTDD